MEKIRLRIIFVFLLLVLLLAISYFRETVFIVINSVIHKYPFPYNSSYITPPDFLYDFSIKQLNYLKWALTLIFTLLFLGVTLTAIWVYFKRKRYIYYTIVIYSTFFLIALMLMGMGYIFNMESDFYILSRFIIGVVHSPLLSMVIFLLFSFKGKDT